MSSSASRAVTQLGQASASRAGEGASFWATAGGLVVAVLLLTNWPSYQFLVYGGAAPLWYYAVAAVIVLPLFFIRPETPLALCRDPLTLWFAIYVVSGAIWLLLSLDFIEEASRQWRLRVLALYFFFTTAVLVAEGNRRLLVWAIALFVVLASVFNWWDVLRPHFFLPEGIEGGTVGRGAGLFINSNAAAAFVVAGAITVLPFVPMKARALLLLLALVGVVATFSRSGLLYVAVVLALTIALRLLNRTQVLVLLASLPLLLGFAVLNYEFVLSSSDDLNLHRVMQRLSWFQDLQGDESVDDRIYPAIRAWEMFLDAPLTGKGVGVTSLERLGDGTHNMFLLLMAEQGFFGLFLYASLLAVIARRGWRLSSVATTASDREVGRTLLVYAGFLSVYSFFSHNVLEEPHGIFLIGFLAAAARQAEARQQPLARAAWLNVSKAGSPLRLRTREE